MIVMWNHLAARIAAAVLSVPTESISYSVLPMLAPLPSSHAEWMQRERIDNLLEWAWQDVAGGFETPLIEQRLVDEQQHAVVATPSSDDGGGTTSTAEQQQQQGDRKKPSTYGEITPLGGRQLFHHMGMTSRTESNKDDIYFYDLGSGAGKLVVQAFLELDNLQEATGIELAPSRHQAAVSGWKKLQQHAEFEQFSSSSQNVQLLEGDLFQLDVSKATHVFCASLCFTDTMMAQLATKLCSSNKLKCVATLRKFPASPIFGKPTFSEFVETSWTKPFGHGSEVYFYKRRPEKDEKDQ